MNSKKKKELKQGNLKPKLGGDGGGTFLRARNVQQTRNCSRSLSLSLCYLISIRFHFSLKTLSIKMAEGQASQRHVPPVFICV